MFQLPQRPIARGIYLIEAWQTDAFLGHLHLHRVEKSEGWHVSKLAECLTQHKASKCSVTTNDTGTGTGTSTGIGTGVIFQIINTPRVYSSITTFEQSKYQVLQPWRWYEELDKESNPVATNVR